MNATGLVGFPLCLALQTYCDVPGRARPSHDSMQELSKQKREIQILLVTAYPNKYSVPMSSLRMNKNHEESLSKDGGRKILEPCFRELSFAPHFSTESIVLE